MDVKTLKDVPPWKWPKKAGNTFLKILRNPGADPVDRLVAADLAGDFAVINDKLAGVLLDILRNGNEPEKLRIRSAVSLGPVLEYSHTYGFGSDEGSISPEMTERIKENFRNLYEDTTAPREVRRRVLEVSVRAPQEWHAEAVRTARLSEDADYQLTAVFCMGFIPGFDNEIMEAMESDNPVIRNEAVKAAGKWQVETDWLDIDCPLISGEDDNPLLRSTIRMTTGVLSPETDRLYDLSECSDNDEFLDTLHDVLTMDELPWDDEFIETDEDDDF